MKKEIKKSGFTLVEIMIVVAIIGLLAAIGIPSFQKARANSVKKSMENNARIVQNAAEQWAMETAAATNATAPAADIQEYIKGGFGNLTVGKQTATVTDNTLDFYDSGITNIAGVMYPAYTSY